MLLKNGDVEWIDFEHSMLGASVEKLEFEMAIVKETIGPQGLLWRRRQGLPDYEGKNASIDCN